MLFHSWSGFGAANPRTPSPSGLNRKTFEKKCKLLSGVGPKEDRKKKNEKEKKGSLIATISLEKRTVFLFFYDSTPAKKVTLFLAAFPRCGAA